MDPCERAFDCPSSCDNKKSFYVIRMFDNYDCGTANFHQCSFRILARVTVIGENMSDAGEACAGEADNAGVPCLS